MVRLGFRVVAHIYYITIAYIQRPTLAWPLRIADARIHAYLRHTRIIVISFFGRMCMPNLFISHDFSYLFGHQTQSHFRMFFFPSGRPSYEPNEKRERGIIFVRCGGGT